MSPVRYPFSCLLSPPFSSSFSLFAFCGMCPWEWSLLDPHLCCGGSAVIGSHLSEHRSGFLTALWLTPRCSTSHLSLPLSWHPWQRYQHIPVALLARGCSLTWCRQAGPGVHLLLLLPGMRGAASSGHSALGIEKLLLSTAPVPLLGLSGCL